MHSIAWWPTLVVLFVATFTDMRSGASLLAGNSVSTAGLWFPLAFRLQGNMHGFGGMVLPELCGSGSWPSGFRFLFWLAAWRGGPEAVRALGAWIGPMQLFSQWCTPHGRRNYGAVLAAFGGFFKELFTGASDLVFGLKQRGMKRDPELTLANPLKRRMLTLRPSHWNAIVLFCTLRIWS